MTLIDSNRSFTVVEVAASYFPVHFTQWVGRHKGHLACKRVLKLSDLQRFSFGYRCMAHPEVTLKVECLCLVIVIASWVGCHCCYDCG